MGDLISVIIPVYNVSKYIKECVTSVLNQTYKYLEIILIDDGSTDDSGRMCDEFLKQDNRIKVIHKKNSGLGYARNSGLEIATGKYITFIDSDDYASKCLIETLYEGLIKNSVDECKMGFQRVRNDHIMCGETRYKNEIFPGNKAKIKYAPRLIGSAPDKHDSIEMCVCGTIFKGDIIRKYNVRFPSERELISEDLVFHLDYLQYANGACTIENTDYKYRINDLSLTCSYRPDRIEKSLFFYNEVVKRLKLYGYEEDTVTRAKRMLFIYIRMSITQEVIYDKNSIKSAIQNIKVICANQQIQDVIGTYPVEKLGFSQRVFVKCIRYKMGLLLYVLKKIGLY